MNPELVLTVSDFVGVLNQTLEYAYPSVSIVGELSNFKVSKGKWVYFDLKDQTASVRFFGTTYALPGPLEDGMMLQVTGAPRLHNTFGFSVNVRTIRPVGEGSLRKAADLLRAKLEAEGLFAPERKRTLPFPPEHVGLVASGESAAYADFIKILNARWGGVTISHAETQVQGEAAPAQIVQAIERLNAGSDVEVIVITRGGGSADDLAAFSSEQVVRAVATSRVPTLVAVGHEIDTSLAELAADVRASTPSNAAELLVPDRQSVSLQAHADLRHGLSQVIQSVEQARSQAQQDSKEVAGWMRELLERQRGLLAQNRLQLHGYDPRRILKRGYALLKSDGQTVRSVEQLKVGSTLQLRLADGTAKATVDEV